ncbi:MAG: aldo/keto reductase [Planctomycetales bacterium]
MIYRRFGRTGLQMPVFSCGGMRYQYKWEDVPLDDVPADNQTNLEATIRRSVELGIYHIETARGYGSSERQLGLVLPTLPRDKLIVQTKIAPHADPDEFVNQFNQSLDRMQLEYVDLLGLHGINNHEFLWWAIRPNGCLAAARKLVQQGKVRHVGFSTHAPLEVILAAIRHQQDGGFDYINLHWYYIFQQNWPAIEAARQRDMGVFIISPADKGGMLYKPSQRLISLCEPLHPLVFNCLFCLSRPEIHTLSLGASCPDDFALQLTALDFLDTADEIVPMIVERLRNTMDASVGKDFADRFSDGLPAWQDSPGYMNMAIILWLRNLAVAYDMTDYARMRYNLLGNGGHWFPGLNAAEIDNLDITKALVDSPFSAQIPDILREAHQLMHEAPQRRLSQS